MAPRKRTGRRTPHAPRPQATDAIVARLNDYGESSAVAVLLTRDRGLVRAVARGARRLANGYRGPLDVCVLHAVRLGRRGGDGLSHLNSSEVRDAFPRLRVSPARFAAANLVLEIACDLMRENEPHAELFRLGLFSLKVLDRAPPGRIPLVSALFLGRAVGLSGHVPETGYCVACQTPLGDEQRPRISPEKGGVLHAACAQGEPGARHVRPEVLALLRLIQIRPAGAILGLDISAGQLRELRVLLVDWLQHVLERRFYASGPLERELARPTSAGRLG